MAFDFPGSPTEGQEFTPSGSDIVYVFRAPRWLVMPAAAEIGASEAYVDTQDALRVAKAGDTMTGNLTLNVASPTINLQKVAGANANWVAGYRVTSLRWAMQLGDSGTEFGGGTDTGSDFRLNRYNDAGTLLGAGLLIERATGTTHLASGLNAVGTVSLNGDPPVVILNRTAAGSASAAIQGRKLDNTRWIIQLGDASTESGGNTGSDFAISRYQDGGLVISGAAPLKISRATGDTTFGNNVTLTPAVSATPANNGEMTFQATSNTSLTIKYKGSDGTVRSVSLTLA